jgi:hypothetical protein
MIETFNETNLKNKTGMIFVFGSNACGRHGKGAALHARTFYGAELGRGLGRTGDAYAIPTKDCDLNVLPLEAIQGYVDQFINYAKNNLDLKFLVTAIGTGLAGYDHSEIAPMFKDVPDNCLIPVEWDVYIN